MVWVVVFVLMMLVVVVYVVMLFLFLVFLVLVMDYEYDVKGNFIRVIKVKGVSGFGFIMFSSYDLLDWVKISIDVCSGVMILGYDG